MKINSIELQNFRQFVNERIEFNSDSDKKVSVIYGRNYIGKTTLIKALLWCLYRDDDSFKADPIHVNKEMQDSCYTVGQQVTSSVTVDLEHNGFGYTIYYGSHRMLTFRCITIQIYTLPFAHAIILYLPSLSLSTLMQLP